MAHLWEWLPERAWAAEPAKPYVPSRYAVCVHVDGEVAPVTPTEYLPLLPGTAGELLVGAEVLNLAALADLDPAGLAMVGERHCLEITNEEARSLVTILRDARVEEEPHYWYSGSEVFFFIDEGERDALGARVGAVTLGIWPMLPHGVPAFTGA